MTGVAALFPGYFFEVQIRQNNGLSVAVYCYVQITFLAALSPISSLRHAFRLDTFVW